jgi:hypothetical protein
VGCRLCNRLYADLKKKKSQINSNKKKES